MKPLTDEREKELRMRSRLVQEEAAELLNISSSALSNWLSKNKDFLKGTYYVVNKRRIFITEKLIAFMENGGENL